MPMIVTTASTSTRVIPASRRLMRGLYRLTTSGIGQNGDHRERGHEEAVAGRRRPKAHDHAVRACGDGDGAVGNIGPQDRGLRAVQLRLPAGIVRVRDYQNR